MNPRTASLFLALTMVACGGSDATPDTAASGAPLEREPLTEADFVGLDRTDMTLELPWTENRISRDPAPDAGPSGLLSVELSEHDGFDRAVFSFSPATPFPGYEIDVIGEGTGVLCGQDAFTVQADVGHALVVRLEPARVGEGGPPADRRWDAAGQIGPSTIACTEGGGLTWIAPLSKDGPLRVLELRNPPRVVVDFR